MPTSSWQDILKQMIRTPGERQRLAGALGLSVMTLSRWTNAESIPQRPHIIRLVQVVQPLYRQDLITALEQGPYPDIQTWLKEGPTEQIPAAFYAEVLNLRATMTDALRFWRISEVVLHQVLEQLDPNRLGMSITLVQCMPPSTKHDGKIRTLREVTGKGTLPWAADLEHLSLFLGVESLAGYVVESRHEASIEDLSKDSLVPAYRTEHEVSSAACPIILGDRIAGCLSASSKEPGYFTQQRLALLGAFSNLISLAFDKTDFYPTSQIELRVMPSPEKQRPILNSFRFRVARKLTEALQQGVIKPNAQVEHEVWEEIENDLIDESYK